MILKPNQNQPKLRNIATVQICKKLNIVTHNEGASNNCLRTIQGYQLVFYFKFSHTITSCYNIPKIPHMP